MSSAQSGSSNTKPADYVYFERTTAGFSDDAVPRSKAAQLKLEHYYKVAVEAAIERNQRCARVLRMNAGIVINRSQAGRAREEARRRYNDVRGTQAAPAATARQARVRILATAPDEAGSG